MQLHNVTAFGRSAKRVGRGGKRGKTAGRGTKGQKARAGHRIRPEFRDTLKKIPKRRGYGKNRARTVHDSRLEPAIVSLSAIDRVWKKADPVTPKALQAAGLVSALGTPVKILSGTTDKALTVKGCLVSAGAKKEIEKAGGSVA